MGIYCETDLQTPPGGVFFPGNPVNGVIRYAIPEKISVERIAIVLKGTGAINISRDKRMNTSNEEVYVRAATFVEMDKNAKYSANGQEFEAQFTFDLPENIPSSMKYHGMHGSETVSCHILYVIRIEFFTSGRMSFNKEFEKEITVVSTNITPKLSVKPMIYGEKRYVFQPLRKNKSIVKIKATVQNSVLRPGGKIEIDYEVYNNTSLDIKCIEHRLVETFKCYNSEGNLEIERGRSIEELESKTSAIKRGDTLKTTLEVNLPPELHCIENSKVLTRCYYCIFTAVLPLFHFNVHVVMPIQIGNWLEAENIVTEENQLTVPTAGTSYYNPPPPNYWQSVEDINNLEPNEESIVKDCSNEVEEENISKSDIE